jgi:hypothetical protein
MIRYCSVRGKKSSCCSVHDRSAAAPLPLRSVHTSSGAAAWGAGAGQQQSVFGQQLKVRRSASGPERPALAGTVVDVARAPHPEHD